MGDAGPGRALVQSRKLVELTLVANCTIALAGAAPEAVWELLLWLVRSSMASL